MKIFAHRGLVFEYPENAPIGFEEALKRGHGIELDVHRTKDGELVVIHDSNTKRLTGVDAEISETDFKELRKLDLKTHAHKKTLIQKIPTLKEVLDLFKKYYPEGQEIAIQIKDYSETDIEKITIDVLEKYDEHSPEFEVFKKVFVFDTTLKSAAKFKKLNQKLKISLSVGEKKNFPDKRHPTVYTLDEVKSNKHWDIVWADEWEGGLYSREFISECHRQDKLVYAISPELHKNTNPKHPLSEQGYEALWKKLINWGIDGICTDYPDKFKKTYNTLKLD